MPEPPRARLSVLVTSFDSPDVLRRCLAALVRQPEIEEIVVSDCSTVNPADSLAREFPQVRFLHSSTVRPVPVLRWSALPSVRGEIIGALEARVVPGPDWAKRILDEHLAHPESPAAGGPVALGSAEGAFDLGLYWCEYGAFAPPLDPGRACALSGANLSYKRAALEENRDLLESGAWETALHERWRAQGRELRLSRATVAFHNTMSTATALRQRFHYGRGYAAERSARWSGWRRFAYALLSPLLPALLTSRVARRAFAKGGGGSFVRALGWILALDALWAAGEAVGYACGPEREPRIF